MGTREVSSASRRPVLPSLGLGIVHKLPGLIPLRRCPIANVAQIERPVFEDLTAEVSLGH